MSDDKPKKKTGRPVREFSKTQFEDLCSILCTVQELETIMHADHSVISAWCERTYGESFMDAYKRFSAGGKSSLRRIQFKLAHKSAAMAIWLGKQWLGQKEHPGLEEEMGGELKEFIAYLKEKYRKRNLEYPDTKKKLDVEEEKD